MKPITKVSMAFLWVFQLPIKAYKLQILTLPKKKNNNNQEERVRKWIPSAGESFWELLACIGNVVYEFQ